MNDSEIIVIDDIIDLDYQEQIKDILLGEINYKDYEYPWYYTKDVTKSDLHQMVSLFWIWLQQFLFLIDPYS